MAATFSFKQSHFQSQTQEKQKKKLNSVSDTETNIQRTLYSTLTKSPKQNKL